MRITGRTPQLCFDALRRHIASLVEATLIRGQVVLVRRQDGRHVLGVYRGELTTVPLKASSGPLHFYLSQMLEAVEEKGEYRVRTHRYWYKLYAKPGLREHAILRWEYDSELSPDQPRECRHHVQLAAHLPGIGLDLNRAHVPTGWVPIEEVIRFLIVELGVKPPCGESWPEKLAASERLSHVQFTLP